MKILSLKQAWQNLDLICHILHTGGVVVSPSDTTYGILVDATNHEAVRKLISLKDRPRGKAISVFTDGMGMIQKYVDVSYLTPEVKSLLPGSYTMVLPSLHNTCPLLEAENGGLGVRLIGKPMIISSSSGNDSLKGKAQIMTENLKVADFVTTLVSKFEKPLTATSANIAGGNLCYSIDSFLHQLSGSKKELIDIVIDAGDLPFHPPSTVIILTEHSPTVTRANDRDFVFHHTQITNYEAQTGQIAQKVYDIAKRHFGYTPVVILLDGELGGGKTTWTKYFAKLFGLNDIVSPTYTYECEYPINTTSLPTDKQITIFKHYDLYNVTNAKDVQYLNIPAQLKPNTIICIEWPGQLPIADRVIMANKAYVIRILFEYKSESERKVDLWWN